LKNLLFALQSGFERMVVCMIDLTTKLLHVVHECVAEHFPFFITQRERHRALSSTSDDRISHGWTLQATRSGEQRSLLLSLVRERDADLGGRVTQRGAPNPRKDSLCACSM